jgi:hypothetical protein
MTELSRRAVLGAGATAITVIGTGLHVATAEAATASLIRSTFVPLVGTSLRLARGGVTYRATLAGVFDLVGAPAGASTQFGLALTTKDARVTDGIYTVSSTRLAPVELFVSPSGQVSSPRRLSAIVNRI